MSRARRHRVALLSGLGLVVLAGSQALAWGDLRNWDWLLVTGVVVFAGAYLFSRGLPDLVEETVRRLWDRGVIAESPGDEAAAPRDEDAVSRVVTALERRWQRYRRWGRPVAAVTMLALWGAAFGGLPVWNLAMWLTVALAFVAGGVLAQLVAYGRLATTLDECGLPPRPQPGHADRAAGLRPVGELYLRQATVVAAIGVFAGVWWVLIGTGDRYAYWRGPYVGVMLIAVGCELLAFAAPLWSFHRIMAADKRRRIRGADLASREMHLLHAERGEVRDPADRERIDRELERLARHWQDVEDMPTWPVDAGIRRRFTWNNVALAVPIALKAVSAPRWWQDLTEGLTRLLS